MAFLRRGFEEGAHFYTYISTPKITSAPTLSTDAGPLLYLTVASVQAGVRVTSYLLGQQLFDLITLVIHTGMFQGWLYVLAHPPIDSPAYFLVLLLIGWYTTALGYLVSMTVSPQNTLLAGIALGLVLGGVANGIVPAVHTLSHGNPLYLLDYLSYSRWGLEALYINWLVPVPPAWAPTTAAFMSGLGFCSLHNILDLKALNQTPLGSAAPVTSDTSVTSDRSDPSSSPLMDQWVNPGGGRYWRPNATAVDLVSNSSSSSSSLGSGGSGLLGLLWNMSSQQRMRWASDKLLAEARAQQDPKAAAAAQLWMFYSEPSAVDDLCKPHLYKDVAMLLVLGLVCRVLLGVVVKIKVAWRLQS